MLIASVAHAGDPVPVLPPTPDPGTMLGCVPGVGSCFVSRETPGCEWGPCCTAVCSLMPECCGSAWDEMCVELAQRLCERPPACAVATNDCDDVGRRGGCADRTCCEFVCRIDPYCCTSRWDELCVAATSDCQFEACLVVSADTLFEGEDCETALNDGCDQEEGLGFTPLPIGATVSGRTWARGSRDIDWYRVELATGQVVRVEVQAEFPVEVSVMDGDCETGFAARTVQYFDACQPSEILLLLPAGVHHVVIAPGLNGRPLPSGIPCVTESLPTPRTYNNGYVLGLKPLG
ncbi:MAG: hypothetical protein AB8G96_00500 [Phycisphaerales bacterium]